MYGTSHQVVQKRGVDQHSRPVGHKCNRPQRLHCTVQDRFLVSPDRVTIERICRGTTKLDDEVPVFDDSNRLRKDKSTTVALRCREGVVTAESADDRWARHRIGKLLQCPEVGVDGTRQENTEEAEKSREE